MCCLGVAELIAGVSPTGDGIRVGVASTVFGSTTASCFAGSCLVDGSVGLHRLVGTGILEGEVSLVGSAVTCFAVGLSETCLLD